MLDRVRAAVRPERVNSLVKRALDAGDRSRGIYPALGELAGRWRAAGDVPGLTAHELRVFSQNGEDGVLAEIFARIGVGGGGFVEFGASDGAENNAAFLAQVLGWPGVFLEADPAAFAALERRYRGAPRVRTVQAAVEPDTVEELLRGAGVPAEPDLLVIDVDGNDYWIWRALERFRPRVVVIEYNGALDVPTPPVMPSPPGFAWDGTTAYGASLAALEELAGEKGYRLVHTELAGVNAFFVRDDLAGPLPSGEEVPRRSASHSLLGHGHPPPRRDPEWQPGACGSAASRRWTRCGRSRRSQSSSSTPSASTRAGRPRAN